MVRCLRAGAVWDRTHAPPQAVCIADAPAPASDGDREATVRDYQRLADEAEVSPNPQERALGREMRDAIERRRAAQERLDKTRAERPAIEREFSDLVRRAERAQHQ